MIKPILCYASELWSACDLGKRKFRTEDGLAKYLDSTAIEKVHVKFCKFIMGVNKRAVNLAVKGELGRFPISFSCIIQAFRYRYHLQETSNSLLQEAASVSQSLHNNGISTWFSFYDRVCKYINAKVDDPSAVVTLLSSYVKNLQFTGVILYRVSVNWIHIGLLKAVFVWKVISTRFLIDHTEFVTRRYG